ncbi:hypothetical protein [Gymnodinialimonas hymeniacidonis]
MYEFYCDPGFNTVVAEARAARRAYVRSVWMRVMGRADGAATRVAAS